MIKKMATAFHERSSKARFEKVAPNSLHFLKVRRGFDGRLICYKEIYEEKKKAIVLSSLSKFIRKAEMPMPYTFLQLSISSATSAPLFMNVDSDDVNPSDVMPISFLSSSSD